MAGDVVRVLIVEDDPAWTDLYVLYLHGDEELRYQATVVDSGAAAREIFRHDPPDCAILDFQLPDMSGLDLLGTLGDGSGTLPFAVVMVSAHASTELATAALSAGALDCLDKTKVTETGLRRAIRTALDRSRLRARSRPSGEKSRSRPIAPVRSSSGSRTASSRWTVPGALRS